jgi:carotenoid 1,2-hydratase
MTPTFDQPVPTNGYAWWYVDAFSDDGRYGLAIIAFVGSVFSPYYAAARRRGADDPTRHCAINVALYGLGGGHWSMTERGAPSLARTPRRYVLGRSVLDCSDTQLTVAFDEIAAPWPRRLRGVVRLVPDVRTNADYALDAAARHHWRPIAPQAHVEVELQEPALRWRGVGYFDHNRGTEPLEAAFVRWNWARAHFADGTAAITYDTERRDGSRQSLALRFAPGQAVQPFAPPPVQPLPRTRWRLAREARSDLGTAPRLLASLEDGPVYARAAVAAQWNGAPARLMHEALSLDRFRRRWVQALLPFRMPRALRHLPLRAAEELP